VVDDAAIRLRYQALDPVLDERSRRRFAAAEAMAAGYGGVALVSRITGLARSTIGRGLGELRSGAAIDPKRVRRAGGGRKALAAQDATLLDDLRGLVEPETRGDPEAPLLWTAKSLRKLAAGLQALGHRIGHNVVGDLLREMGYSLQANRKTREGSHHPDRDAQFGYINQQVTAALAAGEPAISVDTKKKELVGDFKNAGREYRPKGQPEPRARPCGALWRLRHRRQCRLGQPRHRSRHGELRGQRHPPLVADHGAAALSRGAAPDDHRRWRRQQRRPGALVEARTSAAGR
jgi:transposase